MAEEEGQLSLDTLLGGEAIAKFQMEMQRALDNVVDPNTVATAKREIVLKLIIKPDDSRRVAEATIEVSAKLASVRPIKTQLFIDRAGSTGYASEYNRAQRDLPMGIVSDKDF